MLRRYTGLARTGRLPPVSKKKAKQNRAQAKAYGEADDERGWCSVCGKPGETVHAHLFTQGNHQQHRNDPRNWIIVGRWCACHDLQEHNKAEFARRYPRAWAQILSQMQEVDADEFRAFRAKNPY